MLKSLKPRIFALLAIISVLFGTQIAVGAGKQETGITDDGFKWVYKDGIMTINGYDNTGVWPDSFIIPSEINGKAVTKIKELGFYIGGVSSITIPDSVTEIGREACAYFIEQKSVIIPSSVTKIGDYSFGYEYDVDEEIFFKDHDYTIYGIPGTAAETYARINAFRFVDIQTKNEEEPDIESETETEPAKPARGKTKDGFYWIENGDGTIAIEQYNKENSSSVIIPSVIDGKNVTLICVGAFQNEDPWGLLPVVSPDSVVIPDSVTQIGADAFEGCERLASVTIGKSVTSIGAEAFKGCYEMKSVLIPDSVTVIGNEAFGYGYLDKIPGFTIYGNKGTAAEAYAKENGFTFLAPDQMVEEPVIKVGTTITVSKQKYKVNKDRKSVTYVGPSSKKESKVTIPATVTYKGKKYKVTAVNKAAFKKCSELKTVVIGSNVTVIGVAAFQNCAALQTVTIGKNVTTIGKIAFSGCKALTKVTFKGKKVRSIGAKAFLKAGSKNYKKLQVIVPKAKYNAYKKLLLKAKLSKNAKIKKK